ncbi:DnaJ domain-containing protein [Geopyxis carbonaria]|nr:DnaJ domain-containing protein [Geopyxis carbonaria]
MRSELDFYQILAVGRHASQDEIKKSFRKLARDIHPDKNPGDPTAKEKFQDLQRAHETLKDTLERSKYDEDNPYHGLEASASSYTMPGPRATAGARSTTAKRYTAGGGGHTPGWASGGPAYGEGFAQAAAGAGARARAKPSTSAYDTYTEFPSRHKATRSGYGYETGGGAYGGAGEYDEPYSSYMPKESAYARTSQRPHNSTPANGYQPAPSPRPKSTSGTHRHHQPSNTNARYTAASAAAQDQHDVGAYVREMRAKQARQDAKDAEVARKKKEAEDMARMAQEEAERRQEAEQQARRNPEPNPYGNGNGYEPSGYAYNYAPPDVQTPGSFDEEDLMKEAAERMKSEYSNPSNPSNPRHSARKKSSSRPKSKTQTPPQAWPYNQHGLTRKIPLMFDKSNIHTVPQEDVHIHHATPTKDDDSERSDSTQKNDYFKFSPVPPVPPSPAAGSEYGTKKFDVRHPTPPSSPARKVNKDKTPGEFL